MPRAASTVTECAVSAASHTELDRAPNTTVTLCQIFKTSGVAPDTVDKAIEGSRRRQDRQMATADFRLRSEPGVRSARRVGVGRSELRPDPG